MLTYPMTTGPQLRRGAAAAGFLQLTAKHMVATPVNWQPGQDVIIPPAIQEAEARERFPGGWKSPLPYMRVVPQPRA